MSVSPYIFLSYFQLAVIANQFIIRNIDTSSPDFLYSANIFDVSHTLVCPVDGEPLREGYKCGYDYSITCFLHMFFVQ